MKGWGRSDEGGRSGEEVGQKWVRGWVRMG